MPTQTLFDGHLEPFLSQSLLPCSNSVLTIWELFSGHRGLFLSQSLLQSSENTLTIQALVLVDLFHGQIAIINALQVS